MGKISTITQEQYKARFIYDPEKQLLGKGGFASVYEAYDTKEERTVALKVFSGDFSTRYNIIREMEHLQNLPPHENLIRCYEVLEIESGTKNIHGKPITDQVGVLEFANHRTLQELMETDLPEFLRKKLLKDILLALQHLHDHKIVHRDLKPRNILIHNQGGTLTAKITDFGIAKALEHTDSTQSTTGMIGTVEYMSPEQIAPDQFGENGKINHKADLWSFGVLLYHWISRKSLYEGNSATTGNAHLIKAVLEGVPKEKINKLSSPYKEIISSCLVQKAVERIGSAVLLIKQLEEPVFMPQLPDEKEPKKPDHLLQFAIIICVLILIIAAVFVGLLQNNDTSYQYNVDSIAAPIVDTIASAMDTTAAPMNDTAKLVLTDSSAGSTFTIHNITQIGNQTWMTINLNVSRFRNGDLIPEATTDAEWQAAAENGYPAWCYYDNDPSNGSIYGKLYNWYAVNDPRGLAPDGWHVPSDEEWDILTTALGGEQVAGGKLKSASYWESPNTRATIRSGFAGLPGGARNYYGHFDFIGYEGKWWSSTLGTLDAAFLRALNSSNTTIEKYYAHKGVGLSVRCVRD